MQNNFDWNSRLFNLCLKYFPTEPQYDENKNKGQLSQQKPIAQLLGQKIMFKLKNDTTYKVDYRANYYNCLESLKIIL